MVEGGLGVGVVRGAALPELPVPVVMELMHCGSLELIWGGFEMKVWVHITRVVSNALPELVLLIVALL